MGHADRTPDARSASRASAEVWASEQRRLITPWHHGRRPFAAGSHGGHVAFRGDSDTSGRRRSANYADRLRSQAGSPVRGDPKRGGRMPAPGRHGKRRLSSRPFLAKRHGSEACQHEGSGERRGADPSRGGLPSMQTLGSGGRGMQADAAMRPPRRIAASTLDPRSGPVC